MCIVKSPAVSVTKKLHLSTRARLHPARRAVVSARARIKVWFSNWVSSYLNTLPPKQTNKFAQECWECERKVNLSSCSVCVSLRVLIFFSLFPQVASLSGYLHETTHNLACYQRKWHSVHDMNIYTRPEILEVWAIYHYWYAGSL